MIRAEAIKRLREILAEAADCEMFVYGITEEDREILKIAIKALEQQKEQEFYVATGTLLDDELKHLKEQLKKAKPQFIPMEQEPKWIPCSERLPEKGRSVLICVNDRSKYGIYVSYRVVYDVWEGLGRLNNDTVAWMSLPEPYKAESDEGL